MMMALLILSIAFLFPYTSKSECYSYTSTDTCPSTCQWFVGCGIDCSSGGFDDYSSCTCCYVSGYLPNPHINHIIIPILSRDQYPKSYNSNGSFPLHRRVSSGFRTHLMAYYFRNLPVRSPRKGCFHRRCNKFSVQYDHDLHIPSRIKLHWYVNPCTFI